jgi:hypothetical protein
MPESDEPPRLWEFDDYVQAELTALPEHPLHWQYLNEVIYNELKRGRPIVLIPPKEKQP